jgi:hypothetical protein
MDARARDARRHRLRRALREALSGFVYAQEAAAEARKRRWVVRFIKHA